MGRYKRRMRRRKKMNREKREIRSCLCIGYLIPKEDVKAKLLITNGSGADNEIKITGKVE